MDDTGFEKTVENAFRSIAGWKGKDLQYEAGPAPVVSPIHRAVESRCFLVRVEDEIYFAKLREPDMLCHFDDDAVATNCRIASDVGVSPRLIDANPALGLVVYEYLENGWAWGKVDDLHDAIVLDGVVAAKKRLHDGPAFARDFDVFSTIETYVNRVVANGINVPSDMYAIVTAVREISEAMSSSGIERRPCHGDGVASNIMIGTKAAIRLVDFDRAGNADPYFDLGSLMVEAFQFENDERRILEMYEGRCTDAAYHRCKLYGIADDLMWALWGFISFHSSPRKEVEFIKYAEWRLLRARWNLGHADFSRWLRNLG